MSASVYEAVTARIVCSLESGVIPWRKPWDGSAAPPENALSKRPYRGINVFLLGMGLFRDHRWLSFKQAQRLGGHVRVGEKSRIAIFWKQLEPDRTTDDQARAPRASVPLLRYYHVFNAEQCDGLRLPPLPTPSPADPALRVEAAESIVRAMQDSPAIREAGTRAWYRPSDDLIQIPPITSFWNTDAFYATLFHELGHATGHEKRLNRPGVTGTIQFGSETYSREELVAELASAFCCAAIGLDNALVDNSASYIDGWIRALRGDPKLVVTAASQAQRAADLIRGIGAVDPTQASPA